MSENQKENAKRWMEAVYTGDVSKVDELAADSVAITHPIFQEIFDTPTLRGKEAARNFSARFITRWAEGKITYDEVIQEGNQVVLMWTFEAVNVGPLGDNPPTNKKHSWGEISIIQFDEHGKVTAEIGEESGPGPAARFKSE